MRYNIERDIDITMSRVDTESRNHTASMATNNILACRLNIPWENRSADGSDDSGLCRGVRDIDVKILRKVFQSGYDAVLELIAIKRFGWDVSFCDANVRFQLLKLAYIEMVKILLK